MRMDRLRFHRRRHRRVWLGLVGGFGRRKCRLWEEEVVTVGCLRGGLLLVRRESLLENQQTTPLKVRLPCRHRILVVFRRGSLRMIRLASRPVNPPKNQPAFPHDCQRGFRLVCPIVSLRESPLRSLLANLHEILLLVLPSSQLAIQVPIPQGNPPTSQLNNKTPSSHPIQLLSLQRSHPKEASTAVNRFTMPVRLATWPVRGVIPTVP
mmetsp:Transcript_2373/g.5424  ORF Transcript_2373/g.5424 Transcript_2373/m.5424 type:complete len:209 (+) Transcript_2373:626-1252(+)